MNPMRGESLRLELSGPEFARAGDPVRFTFRCINAARHPVDLYLRGREITFDIVIADLSGRTVRSRLHDLVVPAIVHLRTLSAGEVMEMHDEWDQHGDDGRPVPVGEYVARALLLTDTHAPLTSDSIRLRIRSTQ